MLALRYAARLLLKTHPSPCYLMGALEELHAASRRPPLLRLPALLRAYFPVGGTTRGGKHHPRLWSVSIIALKRFAWWNRAEGRERGAGGAVAVAVACLGSVSGVGGTPRGRRGGANPRGFPFPPGLQAEAPDVAALGRQRSFNRRPGTHVSRAPLLLKAPTQGQPWARIGGETPRRGGSRPGQGSRGLSRTGA